MAQAISFGRVVTGLELKTSVKNNPYVIFSLAEHIGFGESARTQYIQVWAWGHLAHQLVKCNVAKDSSIWVSGFLELTDYTSKDRDAKDKRLKLTLKDWGFLPAQHDPSRNPNLKPAHQMRPLLMHPQPKSLTVSGTNCRSKTPDNTKRHDT